jgi:hypothetical protein
MAEERPGRESPRRSKPDRERAAKDSSRRRNVQEPPTGEQLVAGARRQLAEITGMEAGAVTALQRRDDDGWKLNVEVVELARIPRAADVLGVYEVRLDATGRLLEYRRVRRYSRGETGEHDNG